ncbi:unnamed protein product, partial [marine sediment metagenome]
YKVIEGMVQEEEEKFIIIRPSGYHVSTRTSTGLEPIYVENWLPKVFAVSFVQEEMTKIQGGQSITKLEKDPKVLLIYIEVMGRELTQPKITFGIVYNIKSKRKQYYKFEHFMGSFIYSGKKIFQNISKVDYEDTYFSLKGKFKQINLFSIENSNDIREKIVEPMLKLYRKS